jgi:hypothetical protein
MTSIDYARGIKFKCQGSGNCCVSRDSYGYVYLSNKDIKRLSKYKKIKIYEFIKLYCDKTNGFRHLKENLKNGYCQFLKEKKCLIYKARPTQCRTWPFWQENMKAKKWNQEIKKFCPGIGKGRIINKNIIDHALKTDEENEENNLKEII